MISSNKLIFKYKIYSHMFFSYIICIHIERKEIKITLKKNWIASFFIEEIKLQYVIQYFLYVYSFYIYHNI